MKIYTLALILAAVLPVAMAQEQISVPADPVPVVSVAPCPSPAAVRKAASAKKATPVAKAVLPWWQDAEKANLAILLLAALLFGVILGRLGAPRQPQVVYVHPPPPPPQQPT